MVSLKLVYVAPNGSFACTSKNLTAWGLPLKHIMTVVTKGGCCFFNPVYHVHKMYLKGYILDLPVDEKLAHRSANLSLFQSPLINVTDDCSWDYCTAATAEQWRKKAMQSGNAEFDSVMVHPGKTTQTKSDSRAESIRKLDYRLVQNSIRNDEAERLLLKCEADINNLLRRDSMGSQHATQMMSVTARKRGAGKQLSEAVITSTTGTKRSTITTAAGVGSSSKRLKKGSKSHKYKGNKGKGK